MQGERKKAKNQLLIKRVVGTGTTLPLTSHIAMRSKTLTKGIGGHATDSQDLHFDCNLIDWVECEQAQQMTCAHFKLSRHIFNIGMYRQKSEKE